MNRKSPIIIGIAGGTGSGKSTFTNRLKDAFGDQVTVLYHDNYYRAHDDMPFEQRKKLNYGKGQTTRLSLNPFLVHT